MFIDKILYYRNIGYHVIVIPVKIHCYETIDQREYEKMDVSHVISIGSSNYNYYLMND